MSQSHMLPPHLFNFFFLLTFECHCLFHMIDLFLHMVGNMLLLGDVPFMFFNGFLTFCIL